MKELEDKIEALGVPQWFQRTTSLLGIESADKIVAKSYFYGKLILLLIVLTLVLWLFSWVVRILAAVGRNTKAIFSKKVDNSSIIKEFLLSAKTAKEKVEQEQEKVKESKSEKQEPQTAIKNETNEKPQPKTKPEIKISGEK